jgi:hypothetical protein
VESGIKGMELERSEGLEDGSLPFLVIIVNVDHMIRWKRTECKCFSIEGRFLSVRIDFLYQILVLKGNYKGYVEGIGAV